MDEIQETLDLFNYYFGEVLPATGSVATNVQLDNAATDAKPDIKTAWNDILFGTTSMPLQPQLPSSMFPMTPAVTPEEVGLQNPFVSEPIKAGVGFPKHAYPRFANAPVALQPTHRRQTGAKRPRYPCNLCSREFTKHALTVHMRVHTGERPYKCDYPGCSKRFSVLSNQRRHSRIHLNPVVPRGDCSQFKVLDESTGNILEYHYHSDPIH
ncbi:hypothetical protein IW139_001471 [Coemansia sp. RSA 353]|nr:hypothetical protein LPJ58_006966 [Coemansia sp. RSA 1591]KAJ1745305.1 hypothetical protein LPJ69_006962 [Coemansia sp. RSA 1752]KAJ2130429.1 hypothetical protein GGH17_003792 [Coemansia sp. RSA 788]KAJ2165020.1 hypothetical protein GGH15_003607 [Coemansia sp. RSA 562]KAJ2174210.1 hypothetical protein GGH16_001424 [Coemansia sp. RSA 560]KAJ2190054.1 hypothetical protein EV181_001256 [Coemansia sp. RSA 532]KAJ2196407.1 hypothetical protein IW144_002945 [Coemansia sp. RSA 522]KAJ2207678.1 h